jgi:hypothetical protein
MAATEFVQVEKCKVDGCNKPASVKGYCTSHYRRLMIHGDVAYTKRQFHGVDTQVAGISLPVAIIEAAKEAAEKEGAQSGVAYLGSLIVKTSWGKAVLEAADIDLKTASSRIVSRGEVVEKPKKARKKKAKQADDVSEAA